MIAYVPCLVTKLCKSAKYSMWMKWWHVFVHEHHLAYVPLEAGVHVLRLDKVFAGRVQILLQFAHSAAEGNNTLLHLKQLFALPVHHLLQLRHLPHVLIGTRRAVGWPLETRIGSGLEFAATHTVALPFSLLRVHDCTRSYTVGHI